MKNFLQIIFKLINNFNKYSITFLSTTLILFKIKAAFNIYHFSFFFLVIFNFFICILFHESFLKIYEIIKKTIFFQFFFFLHLKIKQILHNIFLEKHKNYIWTCFYTINLCSISFLAIGFVFLLANIYPDNCQFVFFIVSLLFTFFSRVENYAIKKIVLEKIFTEVNPEKKIEIKYSYILKILGINNLNIKNKIYNKPFTYIQKRSLFSRGVKKVVEELGAQTIITGTGVLIGAVTAYQIGREQAGIAREQAGISREQLGEMRETNRLSRIQMGIATESDLKGPVQSIAKSCLETYYTCLEFFI